MHQSLSATEVARVSNNSLAEAAETASFLHQQCTSIRNQLRDLTVSMDARLNGPKPVPNPDREEPGCDQGIRGELNAMGALLSQIVSSVVVLQTLVGDIPVAPPSADALCGLQRATAIR